MKYVFVTGANRGLGKGFVDYLLSQGFTVFAGIRNIEAFKTQPRCIPVMLDVSNDESIHRAFEEVKNSTSTLDFLINNAGTNKDSVTHNHKELVCNLSLLDRKLLLNMFDINSVSPMMVLKEFLPLLQSKPSFVINISSARSSYKDENTNTNGNYGYRASKAALNLMTLGSLFDLPSNVKTFAVHPGSVKTDMNPVGTDSPIDQAKKIIAITKNWKNEFNGKLLRFDGTLYPLS